MLLLIAGVDRAESGTVEINGIAIGSGPRTRIKAGLGLVPEEPKRDGVIRHRPVTSNIGLHVMTQFSRFGIIRRATLRAHSKELMQDVRLRPLDVSKPIGSFSGGNQQKAIIGRRLAADTKIYLFDEPTRGIDGGAKAEIYDLIEKLARQGKSIVLLSSELPEVIWVSDRSLLMRAGRTAAELGPTEITEANIARHAIPRILRLSTCPQLRPLSRSCSASNSAMRAPCWA